MVTGIVFLTVERHLIGAVAEKVAEMQGISEVYSAGGRPGQRTTSSSLM